VKCVTEARALAKPNGTGDIFNRQRRVTQVLDGDVHSQLIKNALERACLDHGGTMNFAFVLHHANAPGAI